MKKSELKQIIREELRKTLNEGGITSHVAYGKINDDVNNAVNKLESFLIENGYKNDPANLRFLVILVNTVITAAADFGFENGFKRGKAHMGYKG